MNSPPLGVALALAGVLALAGLLWWRARVTRREMGLPQGRVVYADMAGWERGAPLYAPRYGLSGKPDYLLRLGPRTIPVEVKPGRVASQPYEADVMQLAAYCLLVEDVLGQRPTHGVLRYADATLTIPYTDSLRRQVLSAADEIRRARRAPAVHRSHDSPQRCSACGYSDACGAECLTIDH